MGGGGRTALITFQDLQFHVQVGANSLPIKQYIHYESGSHYAVYSSPLTSTATKKSPPSVSYIAWTNYVTIRQVPANIGL